MSHVAVCETKVRVSRAELEGMSDLLCRVLGATRTTTIRTWNGGQMPAKGIGLNLAKLPYDVDLTINNQGNLVITFGDTYGMTREFEKVKSQIANTVANEILTKTFLEIGQNQGLFVQMPTNTDTEKKIVLSTGGY